MSEIAHILETITKHQNLGDISDANIEQVETLLKEIAKYAALNEDFQNGLGTVESLKFITSSLSRQMQTSAAVVSAAIWAWLRICRREILNKGSMNSKNCDLSTEYLTVLIETITSHIEDEEILYAGCALIMILASDSTERQQKFGEVKAPAAIVSIFTKYNQPQHDNLIEIGCRAVRNLSIDDEVANQLVQESIGEQLHVILSNHSHRLDVIEAVLYAIINLSCNNDIATILGSAGICVSLVELIPVLLSSPELSNLMCWALRNLSSMQYNINIFKTTSVCQYVLELIALYQDDIDTVQSALWTLANLAANVNISQQLFDLDIIEKLVTFYDYGLTHYPEDKMLGPIAEASTFLICHIAATADIQAMKAAQLHEEGEHPPAQPAEEECLSSSSAAAVDSNELPPVPIALTSNEPKKCIVKALVGQSGACRLLTQFVERYAAREAMVEACGRSISMLCKDNASNRQLFGELQVMPKLWKAVLEHGEVVETVFLLWATIKYLIHDPSVITTNNDEKESNLSLQQLQALPDVPKEIAKLIKAFGQYHEVFAMGCNLLLTLNCYSEEKYAELTNKGLINKDGLATLLASSMPLEETNEELALNVPAFPAEEMIELWELNRFDPPSQ